MKIWGTTKALKEGIFMKKHFKALLPVLLLTGLLFGLSMTTSAADSQEGYWVEQDGSTVSILIGIHLMVSTKSTAQNMLLIKGATW